MLLYVNPVSASLRTTDAEALTGAKRRVALEELEHFFAFTLLKEMRKSMPEGGIFKRTPALDMQQELLDDALSGAMAKAGQLGIARMVDQQLRIADMQGKWRAEIQTRRWEERQTAAPLKIVEPGADEETGSRMGV